MILAKDLMVGDLLYAIDEEGNRHVCKANNIEVDYVNDDDNYCVDFYGTDYDPEWPDVTFDVEPIPLTEEFFEKNFPEDEEGYEIGWWKNEYGSYHVEVFKGENGLVNKHLAYVHQMQHALKVVEIEKEVVL